MFARAMERRVTLEPEEGEESNGNDRHVRSAVIERKNLRQDVEQRNCDHGARTETEQQMKPIAQPNRRDTAEPGRNQGKRSEKYRHESHAARRAPFPTPRAMRVVHCGI